MSASNWTRCPRCTASNINRLNAEETRVQDLYGKVSVEEFDKARADLADLKSSLARQATTFREDYEIYGADEGVVTVYYSGLCRECGLELSFTDEHEITGVGDV